jgi:hypothetical protein
VLVQGVPQPVGAAARETGQVAGRGQGAPDERADVGLVVDDEDSPGPGFPFGSVNAFSSVKPFSTVNPFSSVNPFSTVDPGNPPGSWMCPPS